MTIKRSVTSDTLTSGAGTISLRDTTAVVAETFSFSAEILTTLEASWFAPAIGFGQRFGFALPKHERFCYLLRSFALDL